jgi:SAM-dependent methyltransferase
MVTDIHSNYTSPAGRECTLAAGRFAAVHPGSLALDIGCGYGEGAAVLAREFRCRVKAIDSNPENVAFARELAIERHVSHLIEFQTGDVLQADYRDDVFDLIMAEGGVLSFLGRRAGLERVCEWLPPRGWFVFSDLILTSQSPPSEVLAIFENDTYHYETEESYRALLREAGMAVHFMGLVPPSGWDNYYAHMARRLDDTRGFFADKRIKLAFHREIDVFYRLEALRYVGYLFGVARKES